MKKMAITSFTLAGPALFVLLVSLQTNAQSPLFTPITVNTSTLTSGQLQRYQKVQQEPFVVSTQFVEIGSLAAIQIDGQLNLAMPGKPCTAVLKARHVESFANGDFYWYGEVQKEDGNTEATCSCYDGNLIMMSYAGRLTATIQIDEDRWLLSDLGEGKYILAKKDFTTSNEVCGDTGFKQEEIQGNQISYDRGGPGNCPVRVLAVYTPNAVNKFSDIEDRIRLSIFQTNQALRNSLIFGDDLTITLEDVQLFQFEETSSIGTDIKALSQNLDLIQKRVDLGADIVAIYTASPTEYLGTFGKVAGIGPEAEKSFCIIDRIDNNNYTTAHEIAHLFGCRHDLDNDPNGTYEHGFSFRTGCWPFRHRRETIMFVPESRHAILNYSNPNVIYHGRPTGTEDVEYNAKKIQENACTVADFQADAPVPIPPFGVNIQGLGYGCPCDNIALQANGFGGNPGAPYTFQWQTGSDGFNWEPLVVTTNSFSPVLPCIEGDGLFVKLTGTSAGGEIAETTRYFEAMEALPHQTPCGRSKPIGKEVDEKIFKVLPNPFSNIVVVEFNLQERMPIDLFVLDVIGNSVYRETKQAENINSSFNLNVEDLSPGIYFLKVKAGNKMSTEKIIKM